MSKPLTTQITTTELKEILSNDKLWNGYLWQDDSETPVVFINEKATFENYNENEIPFVIEGFLVDTNETISIAIKNIDGRYYCYKSEDFKQLKPIEVFPAVEALKTQGITALEFIPIFHKQKDIFSADFQEYVYSHQIFKGIQK